MNYPLVSCLMVTQRNRRELAVEAAECFERQTYPNKELAIVSEDRGTDSVKLEGDVPGWVRLILVPGEPTLGDLRNVSVLHARGEFVAQWDDDDLSHPDRLQIQIAELLSRPGSDGCMLSRVTFDWKGERQVITERRPWECTVVARKSRMTEYPSIHRGEDTPVTDALKNVTLIDRPDLYTKRFHGNNKWDEAHHAVTMQRGTE